MPLPRRLRLPLLLLALLSGIVAAHATDPTDDARAAEADKTLIAEVQAHSELMPNLAYLSDIIGPRLTGSKNLTRASEWAAAKMKAYGLTNVHQEAWDLSQGWERGSVTAQLVWPDNGIPLKMASVAWTPGTTGKVVGDVVVFRPRTLAEAEAFHGKLKNALILLSPPDQVDPPATDREGETAVDEFFGGFRPAPLDATSGPKLSEEDQRALQQKIGLMLRTEGIGALVLDSDKPLDLLMAFGGPDPDDASEPGKAFPILQAGHETYQLLWRLVGAGQGTAGYDLGKPPRIAFQATCRFVPGPIKVYNTVGEIRGTDRPDESLVLGAHLDSWDFAQGTTDNGTGSCVVLEAARALARSGLKPRRTIRFVLFTGEEQGELGSHAYVIAHRDEMAKTSLCLVDDTGTGKMIGLHYGKHSGVLPILIEQCAPNLAGLGFRSFLPGNGVPGGGGSDHDAFEEVGVPGFIFDQLAAGYRYAMHSETDTLDKADPAGLIQGAQVMAAFGLRIANLPEILPRAPIKGNSVTSEK